MQQIVDRQPKLKWEGFANHELAWLGAGPHLSSRGSVDFLRYNCDSERNEM